MKILMTGSTGFLGSFLADELVRQGHEIILSTRALAEPWNPYPAQFVKWPLEAKELESHLEDLDACIHLVGEPIAGKRWSSRQKDRIYNSRIEGTRQVVDLLRQAPRLKCFLSASAIGFYGDRGDEELNESSAPGGGFLAEVCRDWEKSADRLESPEVRKVFLRTGVVLGRGFGFLEQMEPLFRYGVGGVVGSGKQYLSWIHIADWVRAVVHTLNDSKISGPVNLTAPYPVTNKTFTYTYGELFNSKFYPPAPTIALKLALGEMSAIALDSTQALPTALENSGFKFQFPELKPALVDLYELSELNPKVDNYFFAKQWVPAPLPKVFEFFSDEKNLERITPPMMSFNVLNKSTAQIQTGTLIDYKLKVHGVPMRWRTEILDWKPNQSFTDTQLRGPYSKWYHTHRFEPLRGGTLMTDRVLYRLPMGCLGQIGGHWLVKKDVNQIFNYRRKVIREIFPR